MPADPTRIEIDFDPRHQRMRGVAAHGNVPFNVPFISEVTSGLWQGGCQDGLILPREIDHVISLYPWEQYKQQHMLMSWMAVKAYDSEGGLDLAQADAIAQWVNHCRETGTVLVHCQAGLNRSSFVVARALMMADGLSADEAIAKLRRNRSPAVLCNPHFEAQLRQLD